VIVCINGGTPKPGVENELAAAFAEIETALREAPGFISSEDVTTEGGEEINILRFESEADLIRWRDGPAHSSWMKVAGDYYESFWVQVATVHREYIWRDGERTDGDLSWLFRRDARREA